MQLAPIHLCKIFTRPFTALPALLQRHYSSHLHVHYIVLWPIHRLPPTLRVVPFSQTIYSFGLAIRRFIRDYRELCGMSQCVTEGRKCLKLKNQTGKLYMAVTWSSCLPPSLADWWRGGFELPKSWLYLLSRAVYITIEQCFIYMFSNWWKKSGDILFLRITARHERPLMIRCKANTWINYIYIYYM